MATGITILPETSSSEHGRGVCTALFTGQQNVCTGGAFRVQQGGVFLDDQAVGLAGFGNCLGAA